MDRIAMQAFVQLVEAGSFSAAAELRVKQSTVSKWIAALEEEFGTQLVERTTRSQRVTGLGQRFYERDRELLAAYEEPASELQERAPEPRGLLRVSVPTVFGRLFIVPEAARVMRRYREVEQLARSTAGGAAPTPFRTLRSEPRVVFEGYLGLERGKTWGVS